RGQASMPVNFTAARVLYRTLSCRSTAAKASIGAAFDSSPASSGRMSGMRRTMSTVVLVAAGWSEQISTALTTGSLRSPSSWAGTWWNAAATRDFGMAAWTLAATDPRGGTSGWNSWPTLARAFAMEITTLPSSWRETAEAVDDAASHGV